MSDRGSGNCLSQTCKGLVESSIHLLGTTHEYALLANFTSDSLEKPYGKLRQWSRRTLQFNKFLKKFQYVKQSCF